MKFFRSAILRSPNEDPADGSGGGGAKPLTEEDVGRIANQAITAQFKRLNLDGKIAEALKSQSDGLDEKLAKLTETLSRKPAGIDGNEPSEKSAVPPEIAKQMQQLAEKLEAAEQARAQEREAREAAEREHQFSSARNKLYESLKEHADTNLHDVWVDHLIHHKRLKVEDGIPFLEVEHAPVKGMQKQKEFLPLDDALPHLVGSPDSKRFMATPDPKQGQGTRGPTSRSLGAGSITSNNPAERARARMAKYGVNADAEFG